MPAINTYGSGNPSSVPAPAQATSNYLDTLNLTQWFNVPGGPGWQPETGMAAKANAIAATGAQASLLVFTAPVSGLYQVFAFSAQATSTNGTLPNFTVAYTDVESGATVGPITFVTGAATTGQGQSQSGLVTINAKAGTTITVAAGAPTTLTANEKVRISFLGS
jgi:hypothetical protein